MSNDLHPYNKRTPSTAAAFAGAALALAHAAAAATEAYTESYEADMANAPADDPATLADCHGGAKHDAVATMLGVLACELAQSLGGQTLSEGQQRALRSVLFVAYAEHDFDASFDGCFLTPWWRHVGATATEGALTMKTLYIETNHGYVKLADVTIVEHPRTWGDRRGTYLVAVGTVLGSSETSRLFHCTSTREMYPKGSTVEYPIYRQPYRTSEADDAWRVSVVSCG
jgi:hypothetical protein